MQAARDGLGPTLLELKTFRLVGHSRRDPNAYMDDAEKRYWQERDPIPATERHLIDQGVLDETTAAESRAGTDREVQRALQADQTGPDPLPEDAYDDLYVSIKVPR